MVFLLTIERIFGMPFWWYGNGLGGLLRFFTQTIHQFAKSLSLSVWVKNLFVPMYGDASLVGRIISFSVRLVMIVSRGIVVLIYIFTLCLCLFLYLLLPLIVFLALFFHFVWPVFLL